MLPMWTYNALSLLCVSLGVLLLTLALVWVMSVVVAQLLRQLGAWPAFVKFVRAYRGGRTPGARRLQLRTTST